MYYILKYLVKFVKLSIKTQIIIITIDLKNKNNYFFGDKFMFEFTKEHGCNDAMKSIFHKS